MTDDLPLSHFMPGPPPGEEFSARAGTPLAPGTLVADDAALTPIDLLLGRGSDDDGSGGAR